MSERRFDTERSSCKVASKSVKFPAWTETSALEPKRVVKRTISNMFVKMKASDKQLVDLRLSLKMDLDSTLNGHKARKFVFEVVEQKGQRSEEEVEEKV